MEQLSKQKEFYKIITFQSNEQNIEDINEKSAVNYFLDDATERERELFLAGFNEYIKSYLNSPSKTEKKENDLMVAAFYLYDNHFPVLSNFSVLSPAKDFNTIRFYRRIYEKVEALVNTEKEEENEAEVEIRNKLKEYRETKDFTLAKKTFAEKYKNISLEELKEAYDLFIEAEHGRNANYHNRFFTPRCDSPEEKAFMPYQTFQLAYAYALTKLDMDKEKVEQIFTLEHKSHMAVASFCKIANLHDTTAIKKVIIENAINNKHPEYLDWSLHLYGNAKHYDELKELLEGAIDSLNHDAELAQKKHKDNKPKPPIPIVDFNQFLDLPYSSIKEFCEKNGITRLTFQKALSYMDESIQLKVECKKKSLKSQGFVTVLKKVENIKNQIKEGVKLDDNNVRPFDYLDYRLSTNLTEQEYNDIAKRISFPEEIRAINKFFEKYRNKGTINIQQELSGQQVFVVNGIPHEVTDAEKLETMEFLRKRGLAKDGIDRALYSIALKRHINGSLINRTENQSTK